MDIHQEAFREEAYELLSELENALLELEQTPDNEDLIGRVFRAMHTIKGSGAMFGFDDIAAFTHDVETVYDHVRNRKIRISKALIDATLSACDLIHKMIDKPGEKEPNDEAKRNELTAAFKAFLPSAGPPPVQDKKAAAIFSDAETSARNITYRIRFRPAPGIFSYGTNPIPLLNELRDLGKTKIIAQTDTIPFLDVITPETCYAYWDIILTTNRGVNAIKDVFIFVEDDCELNITVIDEEDMFDGDADYKKLGEILMQRGDINAEDISRVLGSQKRIGELLVESGLVSPDKIQSAVAEQEHVREARKGRQTTETAASIRVPSEKLDGLVNMVGELVTLQSRLSRTAMTLDDLELLQISEEVDRLISELRDNTMSIRMLPIGTTFSKFQRLVRDLSGELKKEIVLTTEGAETELDKTVIDRMGDPLVHLIRNSIDHGIEMPDVRVARGKTREGTVHLSAVHSGASVLIQIVDDGAGLNRDAIRSKAVERGLLLPDAVISDKDLFSLILAPGFSTAKTVTGVSGRGVGMDVVKKAIDALQGSIEISSQEGIGSTITMKLPLTLAIIDGLLVSLEEDYFVMPLSAIEECVELTRQDVEKSHGQHIIKIRGEIVPYIHLRKRFQYGGQSPDIEQIVTTRVNGNKIGFLVDQVIGQHQTVIKTLSRVFRDIDEISGATILGDGKVALILDLPRIIEKSERDEINKHRKGESF